MATDVDGQWTEHRTERRSILGRASTTSVLLDDLLTPDQTLHRAVTRRPISGLPHGTRQLVVDGMPLVFISNDEMG